MHVSCGKRQQAVGRDSKLWEETGSCGKRQEAVGSDSKLWEETASCGKRQQAVGRDSKLVGRDSKLQALCTQQADGRHATATRAPVSEACLLCGLCIVQNTDTLYFEVLDIPLPELQRLKALSVVFHNTRAQQVRRTASCRPFLLLSTPGSFDSCILCT